MPEPSYASQWAGRYDGRTVNLALSGDHVRVLVCSECASIVLDADRHTKFHRDVDNASSPW